MVSAQTRSLSRSCWNLAYRICSTRSSFLLHTESRTACVTKSARSSTILLQINSQSIIFLSDHKFTSAKFFISQFVIFKAHRQIFSDQFMKTIKFVPYLLHFWNVGVSGHLRCVSRDVCPPCLLA